MKKQLEIDGLYNRQYDLNNIEKIIKFPFKGKLNTVDLTDPKSSRKFIVNEKEYQLLIEYRSHKPPKFFIVHDDRDKDKKLKQGTIVGNWEYLKNIYYGILNS